MNRVYVIYQGKLASIGLPDFMLVQHNCSTGQGQLHREEVVLIAEPDDLSHHLPGIHGREGDAWQDGEQTLPKDLPVEGNFLCLGKQRLGLISKLV